MDSRYVLTILTIVIVITAATSITMSAISMYAINKLGYYGQIPMNIGKLINEGYLGFRMSYMDGLSVDTIIVTGSATVYVNVSRVRIYVTLENVEPLKTATEAYSDVTSRASRLIGKVKAISDVIYIQTVELTLTPVYKYQGGQRIFKGYKTTYSLLIESSIESAGSVIAEAVNTEVDAIKWISLTAPDNVIDKARKDALRKAVKNAYDKAELIANELNTSLGRILHVSTEYIVPPIQTYLGVPLPQTPYFESKDVPKTPIEVGKGLAVTATVTIAFEISK